MTRLTVVTAGLTEAGACGRLADRLVAATAAALGGDVDVRVVALREHGHAMVDALLTGFPSGELKVAIDTVTGADALIAVTPTYQGSYSGLFKSFFDLIEEGTLRRMPVVLAATGGTERHALVLEHALRPLFSYLHARPVDHGVYAATSDFGAGADALQRRIEAAAADLAEAVRAGAPAQAVRAADGAAAEVPGDEQQATQPTRPAQPTGPAQPTRRGGSDPFALKTTFEELLAKGGLSADARRGEP